MRMTPEELESARLDWGAQRARMVIRLRAAPTEDERLSLERDITKVEGHIFRIVELLEDAARDG